jgi:hypothetical protein
MRLSVVLIAKVSRASHQLACSYVCSGLQGDVGGNWDLRDAFDRGCMQILSPRRGRQLDFNMAARGGRAHPDHLDKSARTRPFLVFGSWLLAQSTALTKNQEQQQQAASIHQGQGFTRSKGSS